MSIDKDDKSEAILTAVLGYKPKRVLAGLCGISLGRLSNYLHFRRKLPFAVAEVLGRAIGEEWSDVYMAFHKEFEAKKGAAK